MKTPDRTEMVHDSSDAVHDPVDEDDRPRRNGRRPIPSGPVTSASRMLTMRVGSLSSSMQTHDLIAWVRDH
jgi:hypothetical protein